MSLKALEILILPNIENIDSVFKDLNVNVTKAYYSALEFRFKNNEISIIHNGRDIKTFDFVWLSSYWASRDLAYCVQMYLDTFKIPHTIVEQTTSKISDQMLFVLNKISAPNSFYIENQSILNCIESLESICNYPMIMKDIRGCAGSNSAFIRSREELVEKVTKRNDIKKYMFQEYIPNKFDWGILVSNGKVVSSERSYPKDGEFRNNVGCQEVFTALNEVPKEVQDIAIQIAKILNLTWSRSDIIIDSITGLPHLLEINRFPGITEDSTEVSGALDYISNTLSALSA